LRESSFMAQATREERPNDSYRPSPGKAKDFDVSILRKAPPPKPNFDTPTTVEADKRVGRRISHDGSLDQSTVSIEGRIEGGSAQKEVRASPAERSANSSRSSRVGVEEALRSEYYYKPTLEELRGKSVEGTVKLDAGLTIGRLGYGSVYWPGQFEIHDIDGLKEVVHLRAKEVVVYPDESKKPPVGAELNRPAEVSLERVWPTSKQNNMSITDPEEIRKLGFREKLERNSVKLGGAFVDYNPVTGTWTFKVPCFSEA